MDTTMRASVLTGPQTIELQERPVPEPGPDEVLVRVGSVGVCGSDVHYYKHGRIGSMVVRGPAGARPRGGRHHRRRRRRRGSGPRRPARRPRAAAAVPPVQAVQDRAPEPLPRHGVLRDPADRRCVLRLRHAPGGLRTPGAGLALRRSGRPARAAVGGDLGQPQGRHHGRQPGVHHRRRTDRRGGGPVRTCDGRHRHHRLRPGRVPTAADHRARVGPRRRPDAPASTRPSSRPTCSSSAPVRPRPCSTG